MAPGLEWIAAVVESTSPGGPALLVWYEPSTDLVIDIRLTDAAVSDAAALFEHATQEPKAGEPRRPTHVRVADEALAATLSRIPGIEVVVGDISDAREMLAALGTYVSQLGEPEVAPATWGRLFAAAAALYRARPWDAIPSDTWLEVDCDRLGISGGALTVVGQNGASHGFLLCRTVDDATTWLAAGDRRARGEPATFPNQFYMLGYDHRSDLEPDDIAEVKRQGWEVASPDAYPALTVLDADASARLPSSEEVEGLTAIIEGLTAMVADEPELAEAWDGDPAEWEGELAGGRVRLAAPLEVPETPADPADATLSIVGADGLIDETRLDRYRSAIMNRLAARGDIPDEVLPVAEMLVQFAATYRGATFATISAVDIEALLLETIPAQLAVDSDEASLIMRAAHELLRLAGEELGNAAAADAQAMLDAEFEKRLVHELDDPSNYSPGKQLVMAGIEAGFDMGSEQGVEEFVEAFASAHFEDEGRAKPKAKPKAKAKAKAPAKAKTKAKAKAPAKAKAKAKAPAKAIAKAKPKTKPPAKAKAKAKASAKSKAKPRKR